MTNFKILTSNIFIILLFCFNFNSGVGETSSFRHKNSRWVELDVKKIWLRDGGLITVDQGMHLNKIEILLDGNTFKYEKIYMLDKSDIFLETFFEYNSDLILEYKVITSGPSKILKTYLLYFVGFKLYQVDVKNRLIQDYEARERLLESENGSQLPVSND